MSPAAKVFAAMLFLALALIVNSGVMVWITFERWAQIERTEILVKRLKP